MNGSDTIYKVMEKRDGQYYELEISHYQKDWIDKHLRSNDTISKSGLLTSVADTLHWLVSSKYTIGKSPKRLSSD